MDEDKLCWQQYGLHSSDPYAEWCCSAKVAFPIPHAIQFAMTTTTCCIAPGRHDKGSLLSAMTSNAVSVAPGGHDKDSLPSSLCCRRWETRPGDCCCWCWCCWWCCCFAVAGRGSEMAPERSRGTGLSLAGETPLLATSAAFSCSRS